MFFLFLLAPKLEKPKKLLMTAHGCIGETSNFIRLNNYLLGSGFQQLFILNQLWSILKTATFKSCP